MDKIAAIDYGRVRIGLALSFGSIAFPKSVLLAKNTVEERADQVAAALQAFMPLSKIVIGLPLHLDGKESAMSEEVRLFAALLEKKITLPIFFLDESLTSHEAKAIRQKKDKTELDALSATLILQNFLDTQ